MLGIVDANISLARAGAVAQYVKEVVIFCGGQSLAQGVHRDCLMYNPKEDAWSNFTALREGHDEASIANAGNVTYVIGGVGSRVVEFLDMKLFDLNALEEMEDGSSLIPKSRQQKVNIRKNMPQWQLGPSLPDVRARACAVAGDHTSIFVVGGVDNSSINPLATGLYLDNSQWKELPSMIEARKDHACLYINLEESSGILVTGGLGRDGQVLHSAEFYDIKSKKWTQVSSLKVGRTEHSMALIYGIPTVIGGTPYI